MNQNKVHFPGLNGIRALAAMIVIIFHTDQWSHYFGIESLGFWDKRMQTYAVILFFVLSGFLITYLLLKEKEQFHKIHYKKFYIRRILRIWPVYYTVLIVGIALLYAFPTQIQQGPAQDLPITLLFYSALLPNIGFMYGYFPDLIVILWSVGAEEQFYAFWPFLINKSKNVLKGLLIFLFVFLLIKYLAGTGRVSFSLFDLNSILFFMPFDCMAIGAIGACLYNAKSKLLSVIYHPLIQIASWTWLLYSIFIYPINLPFFIYFDKDYHALVYAILILNVATNEKTLITLENKVFNFLGKISYGIYAYHFIVLFIISLVLRNFIPQIEIPFLQRLILFGSEIGATILLSYISYTYFESWFLKRKNKYMLIKSSNETKELVEEKPKAMDNKVEQY
jgi:peptidoglycan/LPS O-acetylase OafA/YrhL